jgi:hypothetical protein
MDRSISGIGVDNGVEVEVGVTVARSGVGSMGGLELHAARTRHNLLYLNPGAENAVVLCRAGQLSQIDFR